MNTAELVISQAPHLLDYIDAARQYWDLSRHSQNLHDTFQEAAVDTAERQQDTRTDRWANRVGAAVATWQFTPANELGLGIVADQAVDSANIFVGIGAVATTTFVGELVAGRFAARMMDRYPRATELIRRRYFDSSAEEESTEPTTTTTVDPKRVAVVVGVTGAGSAGAVLDHGLHDAVEAGRTERNRKVALLGAGMLFAINAGYASVILGGAQGAEAAGADGAVDAVTDVIGNPVYMIPIIGGLLFGKKIISQQIELSKHRLSQRRQHRSTDEALPNEADMDVSEDMERVG